MSYYFHDFRIFYLPHHFHIFNVLSLSLKLLFRLLSCISRFTSKEKRAYRAQSVNYRSFNERNCAPSPFLAVYPHVANWYRLSRAATWIDVEITRHNFADGIVLERVMRFRDRIVSRASTRRGLKRGANRYF